MSGEPNCTRCGKGFSVSCRMLDCPTHHRATDLAIVSTVTPIEALQRYVDGVDLEVFHKGRLPKLSEWSTVVEMVRKLEGSAVAAVNVDGADGGPLPAPAVAAGNVIPFRRR